MPRGADSRGHAVLYVAGVDAHAGMKRGHFRLSPVRTPSASAERAIAIQQIKNAGKQTDVVERCIAGAFQETRLLLSSVMPKTGGSKFPPQDVAIATLFPRHASSFTIVAAESGRSGLAPLCHRSAFPI